MGFSSCSGGGSRPPSLNSQPRRLKPTWFQRTLQLPEMRCESVWPGLAAAHSAVLGLFPEGFACFAGVVKALLTEVLRVTKRSKSKTSVTSWRSRG